VSLRLQLLLVSLCMLLLPWSGWQLLRQMESLLREGQAENLLAASESLARTLQSQRGVLPPAAPRLFVQPLARTPRLDGDFSDWAGTETRSLADATGSARLRLALARREEQLYLRIEVDDTTPQRADAHWPRASNSDHLRLTLDGPNGVQQLRLANADSGTLITTALDGGPAMLRIAGEWRERSGRGYAVEALIPAGWPVRRLGLLVVDAAEGRPAEQFGIGIDPPVGTWPLWEYSERITARLRPNLPEGWRARLIDSEGWVYAEAGELPATEDQALPWWRRQLWWALVFADQPFDPDPAGATRTRNEPVTQALLGAPATAWHRDPNAPRLLLSSAWPLREEGEVRGVLHLQREQPSLLLADRALGGLALSSLVGLVLAMLVLLLFASRLSQRIRRLRDAVDGALAADGAVREFAVAPAGDEIGDLSRSFARLLHEVGASQSYLRGLAGKLSHELNTPLAVVRGALDNIDTDLLDASSRTCVERARGGSDRLSAIVRTMSEASRMEQAIELGSMLRQCADSYRDLLAPRQLLLSLPTQPVHLHCSPELLVQALDKLIDNARSFCPPTGWVGLSLEQGVEGPQIVVANQGPRLPDAIRHRLFESLVSARPGGRSEGVHLGFGLFIVRLVAELHGGTAEAHDLPDGKGVEFVLRLRGMPRAARSASRRGGG